MACSRPERHAGRWRRAQLRYSEAPLACVVSGDDGIHHSDALRLREAFRCPGMSGSADKMALWEAREQLPDGGIRAGIIGAEVMTPTIFNTGQVLFGLARAAAETGDETIRVSLERAADWLVAAQDADGCWRRFPSPFTTTRQATYNTRCAFGWYVPMTSYRSGHTLMLRIGT